MGGLVPRESDGWKLVASGKDFAVWEKEHETESALSPVVRVA